VTDKSFQHGRQPQSFPSGSTAHLQGNPDPSQTTSRFPLQRASYAGETGTAILPATAFLQSRQLASSLRGVLQGAPAERDAEEDKRETRVTNSRLMGWFSST